ncbi:hypothetical protein [Actinophytocola sp. NPDC049390]|uniref:hypothetical protein n=1 Tax=Actinophytocola sp. NPDC049390 TaxID=3363894 RepID=UPI0037B14A72
MHKYVRRGLTIAMMSGGFVLLGSAVASADTNSGPLDLGNVVNSVGSDLLGGNHNGGSDSSSSSGDANADGDTSADR